MPFPSSSRFLLPLAALVALFVLPVLYLEVANLNSLLLRQQQQQQQFFATDGSNVVGVSSGIGGEEAVSYGEARRDSLGFFYDVPDASWGRTRRRIRSSRIYSSPDSLPDVGDFYADSVYLMYNVEPVLTCPDQVRVGGLGDGPKWVCDPHRLGRYGDCLVYSIGSSGNYLFEDGLADLLDDRCEIHVFDPDPSFARRPERESIRYHVWGLQPSKEGKSRRTGGEGSEFVSLPEIARRLGHAGRRIDVLKIDCEGCEWTAHPDLLSDEIDIRQLLIEVHLKGGGEWRPPDVHPADLFDAAIRRGFLPFHKEANTYPSEFQGTFYELAFLRLDASVLENSQLLSDVETNSAARARRRKGKEEDDDDDDRRRGAGAFEDRKCVFRSEEWLALFSKSFCSKERRGIWVPDPKGEFPGMGECLNALEAGSYSFEEGKECGAATATSRAHNAAPRDATTAGEAQSKSESKPLALEWVELGRRDPWSFSVQRTGMDEIDSSLRAFLRRNGGELPRVVVSFTSMPGRLLKYGRDMLALLKRQSYLPDRIYVALPKHSRRSKKDFSVPDWLLDDPLVTVLRLEIDYGPATKLIAPIEEELRLGNERTRIITVDDDNEGGWDEDRVMSLLAYSLVFEEAAIGLTGWNVTCIVSDARCHPTVTGLYAFVKRSDDFACHSLRDWLPDYYRNFMGAVRKNYLGYADVIEGYAGALYQPRFFDLDALKSIADKTKTPELFFSTDDVWFSGWLSLRNVTRIVINPAFHESYDVYKKFCNESQKRGLSREMLPQKDSVRHGGGANEPSVEHGLHSSPDFVKKNCGAVQWFERKGGWTKNMWDNPS